MKNDLLVSEVLTSIYRFNNEAAQAHRDQADLRLLEKLKKIEALVTAARGHVEEELSK